MALEERGDDHHRSSIKGLVVLSIEVANWRSKQKLIRLRFRVSTSYACCVGAPEVEVRTSAGWVRGWTFFRRDLCT